MQDRVAEVIEARKNRKAKRTGEEREGVEPSDKAGAEQSSNKYSDQEVILSCLPSLVAIGLDELLAALGIRFQASEEMVESAQGADPSAKETAKEECREEDDQTPEETMIEGAAGEGIGDGNQGVNLKEERYGRSKTQVIG